MMPGSNGNSTYEQVVGFGQSDNVSSPSPQAVAAAPPASSSSNISVPGIAGFGLSLLNNLFQIGTNRANRKFAAEQAALANQWNLEQWNRENAYNSPSAQMQRYIDAGLNPNLVVGNQNLAASSPTMVSGKDAPAGVAPRIDPLVSAQIRNLDAQTSNLEELSKLPDAQIELISSQLGLNESQSNLLKAHTKVAYESIKELMSRVDLNKKLASKADLENALSSATFNTTVQRAQALLHMDATNARSLSLVIQSSIAEAASRTGLNWSHVKLNSAEQQLKAALTRFYQKCANKIVSETDYINVQNSILELYGKPQAEATLNKTNAEAASTDRSNRSGVFRLTYDLDQVLFSSFGINSSASSYR